MGTRSEMPSGSRSRVAVGEMCHAKLGADLARYVDVMDCQAGLFTLSLDPWLKSFARDGP